MPEGNPELRDITWPQVVLALGVTSLFFGTVVALAFANKDVVTIVNSAVLLLVLILGTLGWRQQERTEAKVDQVREVSNGRLTAAMDLSKQKDEEIRNLHEQVAALSLKVSPDA